MMQILWSFFRLRKIIIFEMIFFLKKKIYNILKWWKMFKIDVNSDLVKKVSEIKFFNLLSVWSANKVKAKSVYRFYKVLN